MASNARGGGNEWDLPVPYASGITSGQGIQVGAFLFGVAQSTGAQNALVAVEFHGVYDLAKESSLVVSVGDKLWWDNTARVLTKTATGNIAAGIAVAAALAADATVTALIGARVPAAAA